MTGVVGSGMTKVKTFCMVDSGMTGVADSGMTKEKLYSTAEHLALNASFPRSSPSFPRRACPREGVGRKSTVINSNPIISSFPNACVGNP